MSEFETFSVVLSFILGLGVAQILTSAAHLLHSRRDITLGWTPMLWAYSLLLYHVNFLFAILDAGNAEQLWHFNLLLAMLLFLGGVLVLPSPSRPLPEDLNAFFEADGRLALVPLGVYVLLTILYYLVSGWSLWTLDGVLLLVLPVIIVVGWLGRGRIGMFASAVFSGLVTLAFLFLWPHPGSN